MEINKDLLKLYDKYHATLGVTGSHNAALLTLAHVMRDACISLQDLHGTTEALLAQYESQLMSQESMT